jgi:Transposase DDE domain
MARRKHGRKGRAVRRPSRRSSLRNVDHLKQQFLWLFPCADIFSSIRFHGNITWTALPLVLLALCWSWSESRYVTDAFTEASGWCQILVGHSPLSTYQGFMGALATWTPRLLPVLLTVLHNRFEQIGDRFYRVHGWVPIGFDGSRSTAARTKSNEEALCAKNYGKGKTSKYRKKKSKGMRRKKNEKNPAHPQAPQAWITLMWHMGLRLPWNWRLGPSNSSERDHVIDMIETERFSWRTLFCGDAGFVGYPLWSTIQRAGHHFLVRVGANVNLLRTTANCQFQNKGKEIFVLCWPKTAIQAKQPPLRLRLVRVRIGKTWVWLLTNVLDRKQLNRKAMARFYQMRWGIEVEFRGLKQTLDRAKLRCRNSKRLMTELHWSILGMAVAELLATKEQLMQKSARAVEKQNRSQPERRSLANTVRALRSCLKALKQVPEPGQELTTLLRDALIDDYKRKRPKRARYRPPNPDKKPLGDPEIRLLNEQEKKKLKEFDLEKAA